MASTTQKLLAEFPDLEFTKLPTPSQHPIFATYKLDLTPYESTTLKAGHVKAEGRKSFRDDTIFEKNITVEMRDTAKIYADVFRPATSDTDKVPTIIVWSPYGKNGGGTTFDMFPYRMGVPASQTSGYEKFEGPDPADWCHRGYAVVHPDARGGLFSEGKLFMWGSQEAEDIHDTIEWISKQPWSNGSVCMAGNSWLSVAQQNYASRQHHPALKCIAPWWGFTDIYRHLVAPGGITSSRGPFLDLFYSVFAGQDEIEDLRKMLAKRPLFDDFWAEKLVNVENIDIPMYVCAGWILFHCPGSFNAFRNSKSTQKWLRVTTDFEWYDLHRPDSNDDLQRFFDRYTKGILNGWEEDTPKVRLSLFGFEGSLPNVHQRAETAFPLERQQLKTIYLNASSNSLVLSKPDAVGKVSHEGHSHTAASDFTYYFSSYTELIGYPKLKLWMSCDEHDDMDIIVQIRKIDSKGNPLVALNYPVPCSATDITPNSHIQYYGPEGYLRASHAVSRDETKWSSDKQEIFYAHDREEKIPPGKVVPLEITLLPMGIVFKEGEGIMLRVAGHMLEPTPDALPGQEPTDTNVGLHNIHTDQ
ncbi:hypothetical protein E8E14_000388 [Neopestalotiopsis sp. 37M]|nr:hypothetical protein E8E14_000388 [Neopestalotiopsis sp. 37M]